MADLLKNTLNRILENTQVSQKSQSKAKTNCKICQKEFEYDSFVQTDKWGETLEEIPSCCSDKCKDEMRQKILLEKIPRLLRNADVPIKYQDIKTDKINLLSNIVENKNSLYAWGNAGTGKTVFACSVIREMLWKYGEIVGGYDSFQQPLSGISFISSPKFIMELQDSYKKEGESAWDFLANVTRQKVLILDDLGAEKMTDFVRQALYYLINEREQW